MLDGNRVIYMYNSPLLSEPVTATTKRPHSALNITVGLKNPPDGKSKNKLEMAVGPCAGHVGDMNNRKKKMKMKRMVEETDRKRHRVNIRKYKMFAKTAEYRRITSEKYLVRLSSLKISDDCKVHEEKSFEKHQNKHKPSRPISDVLKDGKNDAQLQLQTNLKSNTHSAAKISINSKGSNFRATDRANIQKEHATDGVDNKPKILSKITTPVITQTAAFAGSKKEKQACTPEIIDLVGGSDDDSDDTCKVVSTF